MNIQQDIDNYMQFLEEETKKLEEQILDYMSKGRYPPNALRLEWKSFHDELKVMKELTSGKVK